MILFVNRFYIITTGRQQESQGRVRGCCQGWREGPPGKANEKFLEKPGKANEKFLEFSVNQYLPDQRRALPETETPVTNGQITVDVTNPPFPPKRKQKEYRIFFVRFNPPPPEGNSQSCRACWDEGPTSRTIGRTTFISSSPPLRAPAGWVGGRLNLDFSRVKLFSAANFWSWVEILQLRSTTSWTHPKRKALIFVEINVQ